MNENSSVPNKLARISWLKHLTGLFGLVLILESRHLWLPSNLYPVVPFFQKLDQIPDMVHYALAGGIVISSLLILLLASSMKGSRLVLAGFSIFSIASVLLNQHRFQPWIYHLVIISFVLLGASSVRAVKLLRLFIIGIYVYSALSKMDVVFPEQTGATILNGLFKVIDYDAKFMDPKTFRYLVYLFPAGELLTALLLSFRKTRLPGLLLSLAMHGLLILIFSPLGLNHNNGVLIWNAFFIIQNILVFTRLPEMKTQKVNEETKSNEGTQSHFLGNFFATILVVLVTLLPLLEPWGYFDHWPAWALYSSRQERIRISIHESAVDQLDEDLRQYLDPAQFNDPWRRLRIHHWSLEKVKAPMYPQDRFQAGIALAIGEKYKLEDNIRIDREGVADRFTGKREVSSYQGMKSIREFAETFRLNAFPAEFK